MSYLRGLWIVFLHLFRRSDTVQYPKEMTYLPPRFRGRIVLSRDPDGGERCVACYLCAVACPVDCIALQATADESGRQSDDADAMKRLPEMKPYRGRRQRDEDNTKHLDKLEGMSMVVFAIVAFLRRLCGMDHLQVMVVGRVFVCDGHNVSRLLS